LPGDQRGDDANDGPCPGHDERARVFGEVRARDAERVEGDARDASAGEPCGEDMAEFMNSLHAKPGGDERRDDERDLGGAVH
jgi:hypothetical protein